MKALHPVVVVLGDVDVPTRIDGDANRNASVDVSYRRQGTAEWTRGMPLLRLQGERVFQQNSWNLVAPNRTEVKLTATELAFIGALLEKGGQPCSREELAALLARPQTSWDNRHLDAVVNRLRLKIKDYAQIEAPIRMIYGRGYAFSAPARIEA